MIEFELIKDIFFLVGSVLGIIAFINSVINPLQKQNKVKWSKILKIFDDKFFQSLEFLDQTSSVQREQLSTLWFFLEEVREKKDYLEFKFPNRNIFDKHLKNLVELTKKFDKEITPPIWSDDYPNINQNRYTLNDRFFHKKFSDHHQATKEYIKHLHYAYDLVVKMRIEFQALQTIANLNFIELPFKRWIVNRARSKHRAKLNDR